MDVIPFALPVNLGPAFPILAPSPSLSLSFPILLVLCSFWGPSRQEAGLGANMA